VFVLAYALSLTAPLPLVSPTSSLTPKQKTEFSDYVDQVVAHSLSRDLAGPANGGEADTGGDLSVGGLGERGGGVVLVGASMGGMLVLKAVHRIQMSNTQRVIGVVLVCSTVPVLFLVCSTVPALFLVCSTVPANCCEHCSELPPTPPHSSAERYPALVRWSGGSYDSTKRSLPDSDEEVYF